MSPCPIRCVRSVNVVRFRVTFFPADVSKHARFSFFGSLTVVGCFFVYLRTCFEAKFQARSSCSVCGCAQEDQFVFVDQCVRAHSVCLCVGVNHVRSGQFFAVYHGFNVRFALRTCFPFLSQRVDEGLGCQAKVRPSFHSVFRFGLQSFAVEGRRFVGLILFRSSSLLPTVEVVCRY